MRKTILFIAMSLDGFICDKQGGVGWLDGQDAAEETEDFYGAFIPEVDAVVMGWNTYHQVSTELAPARWPYEDRNAYIITHRPLPSAYRIAFVHEDPAALVRRLREEPGKAIWICGGADIAQALLREDLIDRLQISIIPTLLGGGRRLFGSLDAERKLRLLSSRTSNGITELTYTRRNDDEKERNS